MSRALKIALGILSVLLLALATLPWWLGIAAGPVVRRWGITFDGYAAHGYSRVTLTELRFARHNTTVVVRDLEAGSPWRWFHPGGRQVRAGHWTVEVRPSPTAASNPRSLGGMPALHGRLVKIAKGLDHWLHDAEVGPGEVRWPQGNLSLAAASWHDRQLAAQGVKFLRQEGDLTLTYQPPENAFEGATQFLAGEVKANLRWQGAEITGTGSVWSQPLALSARFPDRGWLPAEAEVRAENWELPASRLKLGAAYSAVRGGGHVSWRSDAFEVAVQAKADPRGEDKAPPLSARLEAQGNREAITLSAASVEAPFAQVRLSAPLTIGFDGKTRGQPAQLRVTADLAKVPALQARGTLDGHATLARFDAPLEFQANLRDIAMRGVSIPSATAQGRWLWPRLEIAQLDARLGDAGSVRATGAIDWQTRELTGVKLEGSLGSGPLASWTGGTRWEKLTGSVTLEGPLAAPRHAGNVAVTGVKIAALKPFSATLAWRGQGRHWEAISGEARAGTTPLRFRGQGDAQAFTLEELIFAPVNTTPLTLAQPVRISLAAPLGLTGLRLRNEQGSLAIDFTAGPAARLSLAAQNFDKEWIGQWVDIPGPTWIVHQLRANARAEAGNLHFEINGGAEIRAPQGNAQLSLVATGNDQGVTIRELNLSEGGRPLTSATGQLPVVLSANEAPIVRLRDEAALALDAEVVPASPLWAMIAEPLGLELVQASARANLRGTLRQPQGELEASIQSLKVVRPGRLGNLPQIDEFHLNARADRNEVTVETLTAKLEGQELRAAGRWAMEESRWRQLFTRPAEFDWRDAEGLVEIPDADLAPLARRLPGILAAQGRLKARVQLSRGGELIGSLTLADAATRPLPSLGTVQRINAALVFEGRELRIDRAAAELGGEPLTLTGSAQFPPRRAPTYSLRLQGKNLPLVRRAGLLLRSDVDLHAETVADGATRVSGQVQLRDGLLLTDLGALFPSGTREVSRRPPYFAVERAPFNRWPIDIAVRGRNALRIRTPLFTGSASAHFDLGGTLGEPRAVGEMAVDAGMLFFPFATFTVQNGAIRLPASDPFNPQITVNAISRRRNYELRLEMRGSPAAPTLAFSSNPPLEASEVLLMVMAGQMPADEIAGLTASGGVRLGQVGAYLGQGLYRSLGGTGENRLEIIAGERISRQGRETYEIAYKLGEKWTLVGEYDEFDSYNAGLKWRVYTQEGDREKK